MPTISKLDAAKRLIISGIHMHENKEDPLATHVVAASALNLLRELIASSGEPYQMRVLREGIFLSAIAYLEKRPVNIPDTQEVNELIEKVAAAIQEGELMDASQLKIDLEKQKIIALLDSVYRPYNFLKHADKDPLETLEDGDVAPAVAILHALTAFGWVSSDRSWPDSVAPFFEKQGIS